MRINIPSDKLAELEGDHDFSVNIADSKGAESTSTFSTEFILINRTLI